MLDLRQRFPQTLPVNEISIIDNAGVKRMQLPPRSPNLHAFTERWVRAVKSEALSRLLLFGKRSLRHALSQYTAHDHAERLHQDLGNAIPSPASPAANEWLGGLLTFYDREAT